jgi:hypothetical protein
MNIEKIAELLETTSDQARKVKGVIIGAIDPLTFNSVQSWVNQCYHMPNKIELKLAAINEILEGFGVEYIESIDDSCDDPQGLSYINLGDTYTTTVVYDHAVNKFSYIDWGTVVEQNEGIYI